MFLYGCINLYNLKKIAFLVAHIHSEGSSKGVTFIIWGNKKCPKSKKMERLYYGVVAGTYYNNKGGSAEYLCLPDEPEYASKRAIGNTLTHVSRLYGTEYEFPINGVHDHGAPCALCYDADDNTQVMMPAMTSCPSGWTRDYVGFLMGPGNWGDRSPKDYICVDEAQKSSRGSYGNQNGALLYHVKATCHGIHCPPYDQARVLACVVCSR